MFEEEHENNFIDVIKKKALEDSVAFDISICALYSSLNSLSRRDELLKACWPFRHTKFADTIPASDLTSYDQMREWVHRFPSASECVEGDKKELFKDEKKTTLLGKVISPSSYELSSVPSTNVPAVFREIRETVSQNGKQLQNSHLDITPQHILEVSYPGDHRRSLQFDSLKEKHGVNLAYHGTPVHCLPPILANGLEGHRNKTALFGEGTYLSSDIDVVMNFSKSSLAYPKSQFQRISCVLVCEIIKHPGVCCGKKESEKKLKERLPETYYIVKNNEHVRLRYMLIYADKKKNQAKTSFWHGRKNWILTIFYISLLLAISLANNNQAQRWISRKYRQLFA